MDELKKKGKKIEPVQVDGRQISNKFWGQKWCNHLDTFADYDNRLPRGRTYVRNGSVCHLSIEKGTCEAIVSGSELYQVVINIAPLAQTAWEEIKRLCRGKIGSLLELLQGKLSDQVMRVVSDRETGLLPAEKEFSCSCSCPDWAEICKHVAAVFYGIGNRLDERPELLFELRSVDASELVSSNLSLEATSTENQLATDDLSALFGIDLDHAEEKKASTKELKTPKTKKGRPSAPPSAKKSLTINQMTGDKLKSLREEKALTVIQFAEILGVTSASIYRWEKIPTVLNLNAYSKAALEKFIRRS